MSTLSTSQVRSNLTGCLKRVMGGWERITITRRGTPVAALVTLEDLALLEELEDRLDAIDAERALQEPGSIPWEQIKAELESEPA